MGVLYAGHGEYDVLVGTQYQYIMDINKKTYICLKWNFMGIPCSHAIACLWKSRLEVQNFVDHLYHKQPMQRIYSPLIHPVSGVDDWMRVDALSINPTNVRG